MNFSRKWTGGCWPVDGSQVVAHATSTSSTSPSSLPSQTRACELPDLFFVFQRISGLKRYQCTIGLHLGTGSAKCLQPIPLAPILVALTAHPTNTTHLTSPLLHLTYFSFKPSFLPPLSPPIHILCPHYLPVHFYPTYCTTRRLSADRILWSARLASPVRHQSRRHPQTV